MLLNKKIPVSYIAGKIRYDFLYVSILSVSIVFISDHYKNLLPEIPLSIPTFIGTSISILLSFKLNQSYDRWWEARKIWGSIVNDSRSFVIQLLSFVPSDKHFLIRQIAFRQIAWCYSLGQSLRGIDSVKHIEKYISTEDLLFIEQHRNKALALLNLHGKDIQELRKEHLIDSFYHVQLDNTLVRLCESQGKAERIKTTVFPVTYRIFLHGFIYLFVVTLSIAIKDMKISFEIPLLLLISSVFFLLEKTATHMQDPFENRPTDTAVTAIARTIEINIKQLLQEKEIPNSLEAKDFYLS